MCAHLPHTLSEALRCVRALLRIMLRVPQVVEWLRRRQFDKYAEQFRNHKITGRHLMRLEEKHLIEMTEGGWLGGAMPVGDRIRLLQDIQRLAIKYQNALRFETKWEAHAPRFTDGTRAAAPPPPRSVARARHPASRRRPARFPQAVAPVHAAVRGGRPLPPDGELVCRAPLHAGAVPARISARRSRAQRSSRPRAQGLCCGLCGAKTLERHVDLSNIAMVNVFEQSTARRDRAEIGGARADRRAAALPATFAACRSAARAGARRSGSRCISTARSTSRSSQRSRYRRAERRRSRIPSCARSKRCRRMSRRARRRPHRRSRARWRVERIDYSICAYTGYLKQRFRRRRPWRLGHPWPQRASDEARPG